MSQPIADFPILDLSGGVRTDKGEFQIADNQVTFARNVDFDIGKVTKRRGSQQFSSSFANIQNGVIFTDPETSPYIRMIVNDNASGATLKGLIASYCNGAVAVGATSITTGGWFAGLGGTVEIDGQLITYTALSGNDLTGIPASGSGSVRKAIANKTPIHEWKEITESSGMAANKGGYYAITANATDTNVLFYMGGGVNSLHYFSSPDGAPTVLGTDPDVILAEVFKDRLYGVGDSTTDSSFYPPYRIFYSALGNGASWTEATDYIDIKDSRNEQITALKSQQERLVIFKQNSIYSWDLYRLTQINNEIGAYNQFVVQEIDDTFFTFCPKGIFATTGASKRDIGEPVKKFWKKFVPIFNSTSPGRVVTNTFAAKFDKKYILYIGDVTVDQVSYLDLALVYDTVKNNWTIYDGFTNAVGFMSFDIFHDGGNLGVQYFPVFFWSNDTALYRMFEDRALITNSDIIGGDLTSDRFGSLTATEGDPVPSEIVTKPYYQRTPHVWKQFRYLRVLMEKPYVNISVRTKVKNGFTNWKNLGQVSGTNQRLNVDMEGYALQIKVQESSTNVPWILNGFIIEETLGLGRYDR